MKALLHRFLRNEEGATAIEYGLIAAGIGLVLASAAPALGTKLKTLFTTVGNSL